MTHSSGLVSPWSSCYMQEEATEAVPDVNAQLVEDEEFFDDVNAAYTSAAADDGDEEFVVDENDPDLLAGLEAAELLEDVDALTAAAVGAEMDEDAESKEEASRALEELLARKLADGEVDAEQLESLAAALPEAELDEVR